MRLHLHGGMNGAAEYAIGTDIEVADALAAGYRIHQDPDDGFVHGTPMMRCKWSAWVGSPVDYTGQSEADARDAEITDPLLQRNHQLKTQLAAAEAERDALQAQLDSIREALTKDRVIMVTRHNGYTCEDYSNPQIPAKAIEAILGVSE